MSDGAQWHAVKELFQACLEQPTAERHAWLRTQTKDESLIAEVSKMIRQHEEAGSFLSESPAAVANLRNPRQSTLFEAGQLIAGRYEILRLLGRGGMGEVYAAIDREIGDPIAVKALTLGHPDAASAEQRFRRELQLARRVTHPNICRVFDFERHHTSSSDLLLITMELVEGQTLADHLREHGPLDSIRAQALFLQVLNGLGTAHRAEVLHRDLKPSNIMLRSGGEAVVMDFGLAIPVASPEGPDHHLTATGQALGTLDYMAPEQIRGLTATERTDVYAIGLVMFETLTGSRPFPAASSIASALLRAEGKPPVIPQSLAEPWRTAILACLEADPARRPSSVEELQKLLVDPAGLAPFRLKWRPSRRQLLISTTIGLPALAALVEFSRISEWIDSLAVVSSILLTSIMNATTYPQLDGTTTVVRNQLSQSTHFQLLGEPRIAELLEEMGRKPDQLSNPATAREVALRGGAQLVVYGTVTPVGAGLALEVKLEQMGSRPDAARRSWDETFRATAPADLFRAIQESGTWIRKKSGEAENEITEQDRAPVDLTTGDWDALSRYELGRKRRGQGDNPGAELLFREAIQIDPKFVSAHRDLADLLVADYRYSEGFPEYEKAIAFAADRKLANWERYRLEAMYWDDANDWEKARERYHAWAVHYPRDFVPVFYEGKKLLGLGRIDEARARFQQVLETKKDFWGAYHALGNVAMVRHDRPGVDDAIRNLRRLSRGDEALALECRAAFVWDDLRGAESAAARLAAPMSADWSRNGHLLQAFLHAEQGQWDDADRTLDKIWTSTRESGNRSREAMARLALGFIECRLGRTAKAADQARGAARLAPNPAVLPRAAYLLSVCGDGVGLRTVSMQTRSWPSLPVFDAARARVEGEELLLRSETDRALARFRRAAELDPVSRPRDFLGFALMRAGKHSEAAAILNVLGSDRATVWQEPEWQWPGLCRYSREQSILHSPRA